jgi:hypothetical protein
MRRRLKGFRRWPFRDVGYSVLYQPVLHGKGLVKIAQRHSADQRRIDPLTMQKAHVQP